MKKKMYELSTWGGSNLLCAFDEPYIYRESKSTFLVLNFLLG